MNGDNLVTRIRAVLRDKETAIKKGEFWSDYEIRLAMNAAQEIFVNYCIMAKHEYLIDSLFTRLNNTAPTNNPVALPSDYLHYISGFVRADADEIMETCQIHIGADADKYLWTRHNAIDIIQDNVYFIRDGVYARGVMFYYKRPSFIGLTSLGDNTRPDFNTTDFDDYVYNDIIVLHASSILGLKEIQTTRDYKEFREYIANLAIYPQHIENYVEQLDVKEKEVVRNDAPRSS